MAQRYPICGACRTLLLMPIVGPVYGALTSTAGGFFGNTCIASDASMSREICGAKSRLTQSRACPGEHPAQAAPLATSRAAATAAENSARIVPSRQGHGLLQ